MSELVDLLVEASARLMLTTPAEVQSGSKRPGPVEARWAIWIVLRERGLTLHEIGAEFDRDFSTIASGLARGRSRVLVECDYAESVSELRRLSARIVSGDHIEDRARTALRSMAEEITRAEVLQRELAVRLCSLRQARAGLAEFLLEAGNPVCA